MDKNGFKRQKLCNDADRKNKQDITETKDKKTNLIHLSQKSHTNMVSTQIQDIEPTLDEEYIYEHILVEGPIIPGVSNVLNRKSPFDIQNISDLIKLCDSDKKTLRRYPDLKKLPRIKSCLIELNNLIGMKEIKKEILDQILHFCQKLSVKGDMRHVMITGPPGVGKTTICNILAKIYAGLGELSKGHVVNCKRSDLIGKYLGFTSVKTAKLIESSFGGVLLLDEAYSLGNPSGSDSFSQECIDMINRYLSEHADDFICIIVGYKHALKSSFFSYNSGLERRFKWRFHIESYTPKELKQIFLKIIKVNNWRIDDNVVDVNFFKKHKNKFTHYGGDIQNLFSYCCIMASRRTFGLADFFKKKIIQTDLKKAIQMYIKNKDFNKKEDMSKSMMYC